MKNKYKIVRILFAIAVILFAAVFISLDYIVMPLYVQAEEVVLPNVVGLSKDEAIAKMEELKLNPILLSPRYDTQVPIDHILFQNPSAGKLVKVNRRVYLHVSGGEPLVRMPNVRQKTFRDARVTLERIGLHIRSLDQIQSELPPNIIVEQEYEEGTYLSKGDSVELKISIGPRVGMIEVPNLISHSVSDADKLLRRNNLNIGRKNYIESSLLTNTIIDQYPSEGFLLSVGDSVDIWIAKSR
ncbi:MAG: hypothetical protein CVV23_15040 [Ignavibacteriae bacterium HGW-Ignavibacteriae-2]|jgi:serine/threonine-protein kinase|nr:PASTA domain-containing protein [Bacteroidota bacterium]PKL87510.1 MAG: hypothetical protein CVV23_15040 [Ignavibacteriae bacterium HGW-Ignavibacteriae-2]